MKTKLLQALYKLAPFNTRGDLQTCIAPDDRIAISCLIVTAGKRIQDLDSLLWDLSHQDIKSDSFEVVIFNDGGGAAVSQVVEKFRTALRISYIESKEPGKTLGRNRNITIQNSRGKYILFLDDDTRILQGNFLSTAVSIFTKISPDIIMPFGQASYGLVKQKFDYLDPYSFATRCCLYTRKTLERANGFHDNLCSYEDIELGIRLTILGINALQTNELRYFHPPLYFDTMRKPYALGQAVLQLKEIYSLPLWILIYINALRFLPYCLIPNRKNLQWCKISVGVLLCPFQRNRFYY